MNTKLKIKGTSVSYDEVIAAIEKEEYVKMGEKMTICHLTLKNGHELIGVSGCVDPSKYDQAIGEGIAKENAINEVWNHMGSVLQDRLANTGKTYLDRLEIEREELMIKIEKLRNALATKKAPENSVEVLSKQLKTMIEYADILDSRLSYAN